MLFASVFIVHLSPDMSTPKKVTLPLLSFSLVNIISGKVSAFDRFKTAKVLST